MFENMNNEKKRRLRDHVKCTVNQIHFKNAMIAVTNWLLLLRGYTRFIHELVMRRLSILFAVSVGFNLLPAKLHNLIFHPLEVVKF